MDAEFALLATLMQRGELFDRIQDRVDHDDFYDQKNRIVYRAIMDLANTDQPINVLAVDHQIDKQGQLDRIGGPKYLSLIHESIFDEHSIDVYADIVRSMAVRRALINAAYNIIESANVPEGRSTSDLLQEAEDTILGVDDPRTKEQYVHQLSDALSIFIDEIREQNTDGFSGAGVKSGFSYLDELTNGLQKSDLIVLAGRPSMGKTAFALNIATNAIQKDPSIPVLFCSLEQPHSQLVIRLLSALTSIPYGHIKEGEIGAEGWSALTPTITDLTPKPLYILDKSAQSVQYMRSYARRIDRELRLGKYKDGLGLIIVDYIQLMGSEQGFRESRTQEVGAFTRSLKALAKDLNVPVLALSQLNRAVENRVNKRPQMSDLRDSGEIEQDADLILFIYRDEVYDENSVDKGKAEIIVAKHRNGQTGKFKLNFHGPIMLFEDEQYSQPRKSSEVSYSAPVVDMSEIDPELDEKEDMPF